MLATLNMSPNCRIFLNIIATYGRSLYALVCGLFISRWVLAAFGKTDFGLYGLVGGMTVIELLAGKMRLDRGRIAGGGREMRGEEVKVKVKSGSRVERAERVEVLT